MRKIVAIWGCGLLFSAPLGAREAADPGLIPVADLHVDLSYELNFKGKTFQHASGQFALDRARKGGVRAVVLPLFIPHDVSPLGPRAQDLEASYAHLLTAIRATPDVAEPGCEHVAAGKLATFLAFEGAGPLAQDPQALARWSARGLRIVGLVHTSANELASSSGDVDVKPYGLTEAGSALVKQAFALGLVIDVSHASDRAVADVLALAHDGAGVVVATHSNARALADHARNLTDAQIAAIAATGGVIGVNFHSPFLARGRAATLADVVKMTKHLYDVAGEDHVAIGSDFEGDIRPPPELADASRFPRLARALEKAGLSRAAVRKIFADNALRVLCPKLPAQP
ncbi:MAG TPA: membrane dipeptidase [Polyangiaceae bacterium]